MEGILAKVRDMFTENNEILERCVDERNLLLQSDLVAEMRALLLDKSKNPAEIGKQQYPGHTFVDLSSQGNSYQLSTRFTKIDFPVFDGSDFDGWLFRYERFFLVDRTPIDSKVTVASLHFSGKALEWHQSFIKNKGTPLGKIMLMS